MPHGHLDRESATHFAVIDAQWSNLGFSLGDGNMPGSIVSHKQQIVFEVDAIVLGERAARSEGIHNLHGLRILDLVFSSDRNLAGREPTNAGTAGADLILGSGNLA